MRRIIVGFFAIVGLFVILAAAGGAAFWFWVRPSETPIADRAILTLDLTAPFPDAPPSGSLTRLLVPERPTLRDVLGALVRAGNDPRIKGLVARIGDGDLGMAETQELRDAIAAFRAKGKPAIAYADSFGEFGSGTRSYYLATAFDDIWLQPVGLVGLVGLRAEVPFFRGTLNKLGIVPRFDHREQYKTAMNILTETKMTPAHREETTAILTSLFDQIVRGIASGRNLDATQVRALVNRGPLLAKEALAAHLVDHIGYRDEAMAAMMKSIGGGAQAIPLATYLGEVGLPHDSGPVIALIYADGLIQRGESTSNPLGGAGVLGADTVIDAFRAAERDPSVRAILFRIDSPGGSAVASESIWRAVVRAREAGKPVVVSMGNVAGSGGYYIAAAADKIVAEPGTLTGSIGVVAGKLLIDGLMQKVGASWDAVQIGDDAAIFSPLQDFSPQGYQRFEAFLDAVYAGFKQRVAEGRKLTPAEVETVAKGRVWTGEQAKTHGLVDALGGYDLALGLAKQAAHIPGDQNVTVKLFPPPRSNVTTVLARLVGAETVTGTPATRVLSRFAGLLDPLLDRLALAARSTDALVMPVIEVR